MTLEHFFTSTELKDGLTTPTRVTELLTLMQKEKDFKDSIQNWSNVANTLATTENKECLDLFVQLDGLSFIDKWLKDAQNDVENNDLEELVIGFLRALERLEVDNDKSGIGKTLEGLFCHGNSVVREKAKALVDRWTPVPDGMDLHSGPVDNEENSIPVDNKEKVALETDKEETPIHEPESRITVESPAISDSIPAVETHSLEVLDSIPLETQLTGVSDSVPPVTGGSDGGDENPVESQLVGVTDPDSKSPETGDGVGNGGEELDIPEMDKDIEDVNEKQEIAGAVESTTVLPSSTTDNVENDTKAEVSDKDEDMMEGDETDDDDGDGENGKKDVGMESENNIDSGSDSSFSKKSMKGQDDDLVTKRPSDMELDYGIVDPLELARQVAIEIERDVDSNSAEQSSSSSSSTSSHNMSGTGIGNGIEKEPEVSSAPVETLVPEPVIPPVQEPESESVPNVEKGFSGFDLNEEISSEDVGIGIDFPASTPISVVSASRPEPATELPVSPLQFEGALGWKGSAATSAFRRIPEVEKTFSSSSSHRSDGLNFDLNVIESGDDKTENLFSRDKMPITSYQETPSRFEKLELDLNSFGGGGGGITDSTAASGITLDWNRDSRVSSFQSYPPTQSLPFKNIDLNLNDLSNLPNNNPFLSKLFNKKDESVFSLFGTQVEVNRKDSNSIPPPNGIDFTLGRPGSSSVPTPYPNLPNYTHNGFSMAPMYQSGGPSVGLGGPSGGLGGPSGGLSGYGSIPYMVDSRGAVVTPQIMQPVYTQPTHPFLYAPPGSNGAGPSRNSNFDLNSGFMGDLGNRENNGGLGLRQFFNTNQVRPIDEQQQQYLRMNNNINNNSSLNSLNSLQASSSSVIGGKRLEPDSGWDLFPGNYKHHQSQSQSQHHQNQNQNQNQHQYNQNQQPPWQ